MNTILNMNEWKTRLHNFLSYNTLGQIFQFRELKDLGMVALREKRNNLIFAVATLAIALSLTVVPQTAEAELNETRISSLTANSNMDGGQYLLTEDRKGVE